MDSFARIAEFTRQPVCAATLAGQLHAAAVALFGNCALALLEDGGHARLSMLGLVDHGGRVHGRFDPCADAGPEGLGQVARGRPGAGVVPALDFSGDDAVEAVVTSAASVLRLPWTLGGFSGFEFLVLADAGQLRAVDEAQALQFCLVATSLFRKAERAELMQARSWIDAELTRIASLQQLLRPHSLERIKGARFAVYSEAYRLVGGDYFDVATLSHLAPAGFGEVLGLSIADVAGHGPSAAVEAAMLDAILRTYTGSREFEPGAGPQRVLDYVNRYMFSRRPRASFVTAFLANYHARDRQLHYACAGHPPALLRPLAGGSSELPVPGEIPLGVLPDYRWTAGEMQLGAGDMLVLYTDGVIESRSPGGEDFGRARLLAAVDAAAPEPDAVLASVCAALTAHCDGRAPGDDRTLVCMQVD